MAGAFCSLRGHSVDSHAKFVFAFLRGGRRLKKTSRHKETTSELSRLEESDVQSLTLHRSKQGVYFTHGSFTPATLFVLPSLVFSFVKCAWSENLFNLSR